MYSKASNTIATQSPLLLKISHWFMLIASIGLFVVAMNKPLQTWDILGYAAAAISLETSDSAVIHKSVYGQLKAYATDEELEALLYDGDYRKTMYEDVEAFGQQIPFYKIRILYIALILLVSKIGFNLFLASHIVVAVASIAGFMAFYYAYRKLIYPAFWLLVPMFFIVFSGLDLARMATVDPLAFLWVGLISYTFIHNKWILFFTLLISSVLVRTDMILMVAILVGYLILFKPRLRLASGLTLLLTVGLYLLVNHYAGNYGWSTVFHYALISDMSATHPLEYGSLSVSFTQYLSEVISNLGGFIDEAPLLLFQALVCFQFIIFLVSQKLALFKKATCVAVADNPAITLTVIGYIYVIVHYLLFPLIENRFFVGEYMIALLGLLVLVSTLISEPIGDDIRSA